MFENIVDVLHVLSAFIHIITYFIMHYLFMGCRKVIMGQGAQKRGTIVIFL